MDLVRACLAAAVGALLVGAALVLSGDVSSTPTVPVAAPLPLPSPIAAPPDARAAVPPAASSTTSARPTTTSARPTTTSRRTATTTTRTAATGVVADRCTNQIDYSSDPRSNAEINTIGQQTGRCPRPITPSDTASPGELALRACTEQTGMTRQECIADAAAGNAN